MKVAISIIIFAILMVQTQQNDDQTSTQQPQRPQQPALPLENVDALAPWMKIRSLDGDPATFWQRYLKRRLGDDGRPHRERLPPSDLSYVHYSKGARANQPPALQRDIVSLALLYIPYS